METVLLDVTGLLWWLVVLLIFGTVFSIIATIALAGSR
jgi:hypothetical protein